MARTQHVSLVPGVITHCEYVMSSLVSIEYMHAFLTLQEPFCHVQPTPSDDGRVAGIIGPWPGPEQEFARAYIFNTVHM